MGPLRCSSNGMIPSFCNCTITTIYMHVYIHVHCTCDMKQYIYYMYMYMYCVYACEYMYMYIYADSQRTAALPYRRQSALRWFCPDSPCSSLSTHHPVDTGDLTSHRYRSWDNTDDRCMNTHYMYICTCIFTCIYTCTYNVHVQCM